MERLEKKFAQIYDKYVEKIYRFIFLKTGKKEVAEDLTSETFLRSWKKFKENHQKIENIQAFLYGIAKNLISDYFKEKTQTISLEGNQFFDPRVRMEEKIMIDSDMERVRLAITKLNEDYQNVLIWHYLEGISVKEIAKMLDRTEGATRVLLHRALKELKEILGKENFL